MLERKKLQNRPVGIRDGALREGEGWWIVMDSTTWSEDERNADIRAALAHQVGNASDAAEQPEDTRQLMRHIGALLQMRLRQPGAAVRPLPVSLRSLIDMLLGTPREPLAQAILALHRTRLRDGRVFVLTEEMRAGLGSRLVADLRHQGIRALLVTRYVPESGASVDPARIDTLLRPGDVVIGLHGNSPAYANVCKAARNAGVPFVVFGAEQDRGDKDVYSIACGSDDQVLDARLFFSHLICMVLGELATRKRSDFQRARLRQVS